jgi:hypothetical protein
VAREKRAALPWVGVSRAWRVHALCLYVFRAKEVPFNFSAIYQGWGQKRGAIRVCPKNFSGGYRHNQTIFSDFTILGVTMPLGTASTLADYETAIKDLEHRAASLDPELYQFIQNKGMALGMHQAALVVKKMNGDEDIINRLELEAAYM